MNEIWKFVNKTELEDLIYISNDSIIQWDKLNNSTILITGATGLIGKTIVKSLLFLADKKGFNLKIIIITRNINKAYDVFRKELSSFSSMLTVVEADIRKQLDIGISIDYIIHSASPTDSKSFIQTPVDTIQSIVLGTESILQLAKDKNVKSVIFLSSMEVYGSLNNCTIYETDSGSIDSLCIRNSYPEAKKLAEALCCAYVAQYHINVIIARLTQTFGPGVSLSDNRVFAQFIRAVINNKDIILHTTGKTKRDYLYTADAVRCIFTLLFAGNKGEAYNLSNNNNNISIIDMAKICASFNKKCNIIFDISADNQKAYLPEINISLSTEKIDRLNNFKKKNIHEMFKKMLEYFEGN